MMKPVRLLFLCLLLPTLLQAAPDGPSGVKKCELCAAVPHITPGTPFYNLAKEYHQHQVASPPGQHWFCYWQYDWDPNAGTAYFWESLPSSRWALQISPMNYCTVWTAEFHFDIHKNSPTPKQDTLEIQLQEATSPYSLIYKTFFLVNPNAIESLYPLYPALGAPYSTGNPIINTKRNFLLTAKMRGPTSDSVQWQFRTPSMASTSYRFTSSNTLQGASNAVGQSVDLYWGAELCVHIPIPIELTTFSAEKRSDDVLLLWETASEVNNYGFRIQRAPSRQGPWEMRGFVPGRGNSATRQQYLFDDPIDIGDQKAFSGGEIWYRLVQMDYDGSIEEYRPLLVSAGGIPDGFALQQNFPNPFGGSSASGASGTTFQYSLAGESDVELTVSDAFGRTLATIEKGRKNGGVHSVQWIARDLPSGAYFVRLASGSAAATKKFIYLR